MNFKKRISSIASGVLSVALITSMFASSALAATKVQAAMGDNVISSYTVNGEEFHVKNPAGYPAQATRNTKQLVFSVPDEATSFGISVDGQSMYSTKDFKYSGNAKIVIINTSDVSSSFISSNGCFKKGTYDYSASNATATSPNTIFFDGTLYVDNTADSNKTANMEYHMKCTPVEGINNYFPYKQRPDYARDVASLTLKLTNYVGEYYYVVYWQPDYVTPRNIYTGGSKLPDPVAEPTTSYPVYVSPMKYANEFNPLFCEYGKPQGVATFGGYMPKGTYTFKIYNAVGDRIYANAGYTDENIGMVTNQFQTTDYMIPAVKPAAPVKPIIVCPDDPNYPNGPIAPVYTGDPVAATLDGNKIPVTDVVKTPDGSFDLTDDAKKDLSPAAHKLVVTLDDGTKKEVTVWGTNTANDPYSGKGLDGFVARLYRVVLEREPEAAGHKAWVDALKNRVQLADGSGTANGLSTALGFFNSPEFLGKNVTDDDFIRRCYKTFFDRTPDKAGYDEWMKLLKSGTSREDIIKGFANSNEWVMLCWGFDINSGAAGVPDTTGIPYNEDAINFVRRIYTVALGRPGDPIGVTAWSIALIQKTATGSQVAKGLFFSPELEAQKISDKDFITRLYGVFLDRQPDAKGLTDWTAYLQATDRVKTFDAFTSNGEWKALCAKYGINP